jgi:hypothetical protein
MQEKTGGWAHTQKSHSPCATRICYIDNIDTSRSKKLQFSTYVSDVDDSDIMKCRIKNLKMKFSLLGGSRLPARGGRRRGESSVHCETRSGKSSMWNLGASGAQI